MSCSLPVIGFSFIGIGNAFPLHHLPLTHKRGRSTRTSISYKTIDPIEKEQISSSSSNRLGDGDNNDGGGGETITADEYGRGSGDDSVEDNAWLSATRTLGSLFLRQEDADRDRNVDVFGRPMVEHETESFDASSSPFSLHENSFAKYLMDLKFQEEENRERAAEHHSTKSIDAWRDNLGAQKLSLGIEIDQVRSGALRL
jgi:hypothetical protein